MKLVKNCFCHLNSSVDLNPFVDRGSWSSCSWLLLWIGVVGVVPVDCWVVGVLADGTLTPVVEIDEVILTEPLICLMINEDYGKYDSQYYTQLWN